MSDVNEDDSGPNLDLLPDPDKIYGPAGSDMEDSWESGSESDQEKSGSESDQEKSGSESDQDGSDSSSQGPSHQNEYM